MTLTPEGLADVPGWSLYASTGEQAEVQTRAWALHGRTALEVVVECMEPQMDALVAEVQPGEDDARVFTDDCIEIFAGPRGSEDDYLHLAVNALGATFDERVKDTSWQGLWQAEAHREADRWWVRVSIPYPDLQRKPLADLMWWFNVSRERQAGGALQLSSWSDAAANFHNIRRWGGSSSRSATHRSSTSRSAARGTSARPLSPRAQRAGRRSRSGWAPRWRRCGRTSRPCGPRWTPTGRRTSRRSPRC